MAGLIQASGSCAVEGCPGQISGTVPGSLHRGDMGNPPFGSIWGNLLGIQDVPFIVIFFFGKSKFWNYCFPDFLKIDKDDKAKGQSAKF